MSGTFSVLLNFNGTTGENPVAGVTPVVTPTGVVLYGTTNTGGTSGDGTLYSYNVATGTSQTLLTFGGGNGAHPTSAVTDSGGILYGTTNQGGTLGLGTVFAYDLATGAEQTLVNFGGSLGTRPSGGVTAVGGMLYGTTTEGGSSGDGTLYAYDMATGTTRTLVNFNGTNGTEPFAGLTDVGGILYGCTAVAGPGGGGTLFGYDIATGTLQTLVSFGGTNGANPVAAVTDGGNGVLYGTTFGGGSSNQGTVFAYTIATGTLQTLVNFNTTDGANPGGGVIDANGNLFGVTESGGASGGGVLFDYNIATHTEQTLVNLGGASGSGSSSTLAGVGDTLYGTAFQGGIFRGGTLFSYTLACFAAGTLLATPAGEVDVASLRVGDTVMTALDGRRDAAPIVWIGRCDVDIARHPSPASVRPVRVRAGAFGPGRPARDLWLSPDHALYFDGALIPVKYLIDGGMVAPDMGRATIRYDHVALARHAVLLAEGLPAESFLETAGGFGRDADGTLVVPDAGFAPRAREAGACAPLEVTGPRVAAARRALRRDPIAA